MTQLHKRFTDLGPLCSKQARTALESVEFIIPLYPYCAMENFEYILLLKSNGSVGIKGFQV